MVAEERKTIIMAPTGMTIILTVLVAMAFCVILVMCINCFLGVRHELEAKNQPPNQRPRRNGAGGEQMLKPASLLQVL